MARLLNWKPGVVLNSGEARSPRKKNRKERKRKEKKKKERITG
jgi:hypothetical protein